MSEAQEPIDQGNDIASADALPADGGRIGPILARAREARGLGINDVVQTLMRPASGAVLFAAAFGADSTWTQAAALIAGMVTAGTVHGAKAAARPVVNVSTGGVGAPVVSTVEDITSVVLTLAAIFVPVLVLVLLAAMAWLGWRLRRRWRERRAQRQPEPQPQIQP